jgi:thymidylate synthase
VILNYNLRDYHHSDNFWEHIGRDLTQYGDEVDTGHWQALEGVPHTKTREMRNVLIGYNIPPEAGTLVHELSPNMPWAEEEFEVRVSGTPHNPHPSVVNWPWYSPDWEAEKGGQYSHTYAERYWPKRANRRDSYIGSNPGIRHSLGDLNDVVALLAKHPHTRQAYLPVWFPEDTGAVHGERVPCSLGYHWLLRNGQLHCNYQMRSCDFLRYLRDDMYLTARLTQWVADRVMKSVGGGEAWGVQPGQLTMLIGSLHVFEGDMPKMRRLYG